MDLISVKTQIANRLAIADVSHCSVADGDIMSLATLNDPTNVIFSVASSLRRGTGLAAAAVIPHIPRYWLTHVHPVT